MSDIEKLVLTNFIFNEEFGRKVAPFLKSEYFSDFSNKIVFTLAEEYINKYNAFPSTEVLNIELGKATGLSQEDYNQTKNLLKDLRITVAHDAEYLSDVAEEWCQERAIHLALLKSISIVEGDDKNLSKGAIPEILSDALAVSFDSAVGHDFLNDSEERYEFYKKKEKRIPFHLSLLNTITNGGIPSKTLNIILAGVGVGKTMFMCDMAAHHLAEGYKVLYITLEMAEERIAERIDANLLDIPLDDLKAIPKAVYQAKMSKLKGTAAQKGGRLFVKEYPTANANTGHFRHLLHELKIKKKFIPDIIYVDYINICTSSRFKNGGGNMNSYFYIKSIAEELRGLAVEKGVPIISATQLTRSGYTSSDVGLEDTAESFGLPATADFMISLTSTEELIALSQLMVKQQKNRYGNPNINKRFVIGVDHSKMRFYDVESKGQEDILDGPKTTKSSKPKEKKDKYKVTDRNKNRFSGFK
jgi:replicative DNA helicase